MLGWGGLLGQQSTVLHERNPKCLLKMAGLSSFNTLSEQRVDKRLWVQIQFQFWLCQLTTYMFFTKLLGTKLLNVNLSLICEKRMIALKSIAFNLRGINRVCKALITLLKMDCAQ